MKNTQTGKEYKLSDFEKFEVFHDKGYNGVHILAWLKESDGNLNAFILVAKENRKICRQIKSIAESKNPELYKRIAWRDVRDKIIVLPEELGEVRA